MKTLVIVPHLDDEALSCGALIHRRVAAQAGLVMVLAVYGRVYDYGRINHDSEELSDFYEAKKVLGYQYHEALMLPEGEPAQVGYYKTLEAVEKALGWFHPDEVVVPSPLDLNQDHRFLSEVMRIALRPANLFDVRRVLEFRAFDSQLSEPNYFVPFQDETMAVKMAAIAKYRREARAGNHPRSPENIDAFHRVCGSKCGAKYAEAYTVRLEREQCVL